MAFSPTLDICFETCSRIRFTDTTNVYNASTNLTGWGVANTAEGVDVTSAIITILDSDDAVSFTYDVTDTIPDTVTGDIIYLDYTATTLEDGEYTLQYEIIFTDNSRYTYTSDFLNSCNFEACIDELIATIPAKLCADKCNTDYIDEVLLIEGLLFGYKCAAICEKETIKNEIELRLTRFCDLNCNC